MSYVSRACAYRRAIGIDKFEGNDATEWGTQNEANGILAYQQLTGNIVKASGLHIHPHLDWLAGSPDGLVGEEGMVEIKCPFYHRKGGRLHKKVPPHYFMQVNALLEICNRKWCDYVCWAPEGMVVYRVYRNSACFDFLLPFYTQFYAAMEAKADNPPPLSKDEKALIILNLAEADTQINYTYWDLVDPTAPFPSSDPHDSAEDENETCSPHAKRQCVPELCRSDNQRCHSEETGIGQAASSIPV